MQAGRLRHDFEERIKAGTEDFRRDMLERLDATITGIEEAVTKGMAVRQAGVQAASSRLAGLGSALETMDALETAIRQDSDPPR